LRPQINTFYLRKEAEYKSRLEKLLSQRRAAAMRVLPVEGDDNVHNHVEWNVVEEGFRQLERDLSKLQVRLVENARRLIAHEEQALCRAQCYWIPKNSEEVGQAVEIDNERAIPGSSGGRSAGVRSSGELRCTSLK
jgi:hypothetical protein